MKASHLGSALFDKNLAPLTLILQCNAMQKKKKSNNGWRDMKPCIPLAPQTGLETDFQSRAQQLFPQAHRSTVPRSTESGSAG